MARAYQRRTAEVLGLTEAQYNTGRAAYAKWHTANREARRAGRPYPAVTEVLSPAELDDARTYNAAQKRMYGARRKARAHVAAEPTLEERCEARWPGSVKRAQSFKNRMGEVKRGTPARPRGGQQKERAPLPVMDECPREVFLLVLERQNGLCAIEGVPLTMDDVQVDRIIPELGYMEWNVQLLTSRANRVKSDGDARLHYQIAENIDRNMARMRAEGYVPA